MKKISILIFLILLFTSSKKQAQTVDIIISKKADNIEKLAANELSKYLNVIYPSYTFPVSTSSKAEQSIYIGKKECLPKKIVSKAVVPENEEGFAIFNKQGKTGVITSSGAMGVLFGVYELLEKMGYTFLLSGDYAPSEKEKFNFDSWNIVNEPLTEERHIFNWHNFLTGCTTWDYEDWELWINQSQKMGYNAIMLHAYANNPMFTFKYNNIEKPVGYIATSAKGRDWSIQHVNDVRRLPGGEVFNSAIFGSKSAIVPDDKRIVTVQNLMKRVF